MPTAGPPPVPPADRIFVTGMRFRGFHGVLPEERRDGQEFVVDVVLETDLTLAGRRDDLAETVDYRAIYDLTREIVTGQPVQLIETLAERIAARCLAADLRVRQVTVTVHKPEVPLPGPLTETAVQVTRRRGGGTIL